MPGSPQHRSGDGNVGGLGALGRLFASARDLDVPDSADVDWWRSRILGRLLVTFLVFSVVAVVPSVVASISVGAWALVVVDLAFVAWFAVLWRFDTIPSRIRTRLLLFSVYALAAGLLGFIGSRGAGFIWLFGYVVLTALLLGHTALLQAIALSLITVAGFTFASHHAPLDSPYPDWRLLWAVLGGNTVLLAAVVAAAMSGVLEGLGRTLHRGATLRDALSERNHALDHSNRALQAEIQRREESEAARERLQQQLAQAEKMDALGRLSRGIAHDLNNLLQPIVMHGEFIREAAPADATWRQDAEQVLMSASRASSLVRQVLTFGQQVAPHIERVNLLDHINQTVSLARAATRSTATVRVRGPSTPVHVYIDPTHLHQLVMNLCTNALQAMNAEGGLLEVACGVGKPTLKDRQVHRHQAGETDRTGPDACAWVTVTDTGPGIGAELVDRVFEPFFTTRVDQGGTGLGLSIVHGLVLRAGGSLTLSTGPGEGTAFAIALPCANPSVAPTPPPRPVPSSPPDVHPCVLVVDDEPTLRRVTARILRKGPFEVIVADSAEAALDLVTEGNQAVDMVLSDRRMPHMTGEELAEQLAVLRPDLPVVLMSGDGTERSPEDLTRLGVREVLAKPFGSKQLLATIHTVLGLER